MQADIYGGAELLKTTRTRGQGRDGKLPLDADMLLDEASGNLFAMTQNVAMGWHPEEVNREQYVIVSTQGGLRAEDGAPVALGYHTGHWEIGLLVARSRRDDPRPGRHTLRGLLLRSLRRALPGHQRHDGQPALSQRRRPGHAPHDPLPAHARRRHGRRHLRQGPARRHESPWPAAATLPGIIVPGGVTSARRRRGRRRHRADHRRPLRPRS